MSLAIRLDLSNLKQLQEVLAGLAAAGNDGSRLLSGLGRLIREQTVDRITSGGPAPDGAVWSPNRAGTKLLYRSGALARSIDYTASATQVVVGSALIYAGIHQTGGTIRAKGRALRFRSGNGFLFRKSVTIPKRPYIGISAADRTELVAAVAAWIRRQMPGVAP